MVLIIIKRSWFKESSIWICSSWVVSILFVHLVISNITELELYICVNSPQNHFLIVILFDYLKKEANEQLAICSH